MRVALPARTRNRSKRERTSLYQSIVFADLPSVRLWNSKYPRRSARVSSFTDFRHLLSTLVLPCATSIGAASFLGQISVMPV